MADNKTTRPEGVANDTAEVTELHAVISNASSRNQEGYAIEGWKFALIMVALSLAVLCMALVSVYVVRLIQYC
jgi:hypothetical protein